MLEVKNLCKTYRRNEALTDANIRFEENKIYGLLGRNGAGKTTLLDCITGRIFPTSGESLLDGEPTIENDAALSQIYLMNGHIAKPVDPDKMYFAIIEAVMP